MPKVTIDGQSIEVPAGTTVLRAAKQLGIDIPVFCYHPGLSIAANCRMCLVEIEKSPKPLPGCYTEVGEGMVVHTQTERIKATQKAVLEFILLNHPVDCPICDQAGECVLQEHYAHYSLQASRLMHEKVGKPKAKPLGPNVILDAERCIVCTRCVRFCEEVTKTCELTVESRGEHSEITTPEGVELNNAYSQNVVDICPVGALTSRQFRFSRRVWFLDMRDSVCTGCGRGCSVRVDSHKNQVERLLPRYNPDVNSYWMCDDGRKSLDGLKDGLAMGWLPGPDGQARQAPAVDGVRALAGWLQEAKKAGQAEVGIGLSASLSNEDIYAWAKLAKAAGAKVYLLPRGSWQGDKLLRTDDRDCNTTGAKAILASVLGSFGGTDELVGDTGALEVLLVVDNGAACDGDLAEALARVPKLGVLASEASEWTQAASVVVPLTPLQGRDGTITNVAGWVQRLQQPLKPAVTSVAPHVAAAMLAAGDEGLDFADKTRPAELFERLASAVGEFKGLNYGEIGDLGRALPQDGALAPRRPRQDGTPQWEPDPVSPTFKRPFQLRRGA